MRNVTVRFGASSLLLLLLPTLLLSPRATAQMEDVTVEAIPVRDGVYMLTGAGGNMGLGVGDDATFLVDDQFAPLSERIVAAIARVSDRPVDYVLNTHWHYDHTGGNENFGERGALILAHDNVRTRMVEGQTMANGRVVEPAVPGALPVVTFNDKLALHVNGHTIRGHHVEHAHTDGDTLVHFEEANVFHMGDTFVNGGYPFVDLRSGGHIDGIIEAAATVLALSDGETRIIPGHGALASKADLQRYHDMLVTIRDRVAARVAKGESLEVIVAAKPTADFDAAVDANGFIKPDMLVEAIFRSLAG